MDEIIRTSTERGEKRIMTELEKNKQRCRGIS